MHWTPQRAEQNLPFIPAAGSNATAFISCAPKPPLAEAASRRRNPDRTLSLRSNEVPFLTAVLWPGSGATKIIS